LRNVGGPYRTDVEPFHRGLEATREVNRDTLRFMAHLATYNFRISGQISTFFALLAAYATIICGQKYHLYLVYKRPAEPSYQEQQLSIYPEDQLLQKKDSDG
jgi:hypothetical protein